MCVCVCVFALHYCFISPEDGEYVQVQIGGDEPQSVVALLRTAR